MTHRASSPPVLIDVAVSEEHSSFTSKFLAEMVPYSASRAVVFLLLHQLIPAELCGTRGTAEHGTRAGM